MPSPFRHRPPAAGSRAVQRGPGLCALALLLAGSCLTAQAQPDLRSTFPGRRVGGATRGECSARLIVHLVPTSSVLAPASTGLALLQGPSLNPRPLAVELRPLGRDGAPDRSLKPLLQRTLPAEPAGVTLLSLAAVQAPTVWESSYVCSEAGAAGAAKDADPLSFVESASPPALSLLVPSGSGEDQRIQAAVQNLRRSCGGTVPRAELARNFGLDDLLRGDWPEQLPVRCL